MINRQLQLKDDVVTLKELSISDTLALFEMRSDNQLSRQAGISVDTHPAHTLAFILDVNKKVKDRYFYYWGIFVGDDLVGVISLWGFDYNAKSGELGYFIGKNFQRNGYMSRAIKLVVNNCLSESQISSVDAYIETTNNASIKLVKKLGFKLAGESLEEDQSDNFVSMYRYNIKELID